MLKDILAYANKQLLGDPLAGLEADTPLLEIGVLNSLSMVTLLEYIEETFGVAIPDEKITPENFADINSVWNLVSALSDQSPSFRDNVSEHHTMIALQESRGIQSEIIEFENGAVQHVLRVAGSGPLWIMLPALGSSSVLWSPMLSTIKGRTNAVALDLAGFGLSQCGKEAPVFEDHLALTLRYLQTLEEKEWVLVSSSAGGLLTAEIAKRFPNQVKATIMTGFGQVEDVDSWWQNLQTLSQNREKFLAAAYYHPPAQTPALNRLLDDILSRPAYHNFLDHKGKKTMKTIFKNIAVPTMFVNGEDDNIMPIECIEKAVGQVSGAEAVYLSRCGHFVPADKPEELLWLIDDFLRGLEN